MTRVHQGSASEGIRRISGRSSADGKDEVSTARNHLGVRCARGRLPLMPGGSMATRHVRSFWLAAASVLLVWAAAAPRVPVASAQAAATGHPPERRRRRGRHGLVGHRAVWQRDPNSQSRRPCRAGPAIHPVLFHTALLADAREPIHRLVFAPGGQGHLDNVIRRGSLAIQGGAGESSLSHFNICRVRCRTP